MEEACESLTGSADQFAAAAGVAGVVAIAEFMQVAYETIMRDPEATDMARLSAYQAVEEADLTVVAAMGANSRFTAELIALTDE
jgi:hypothetical protein